MTKVPVAFVRYCLELERYIDFEDRQTNLWAAFPLQNPEEESASIRCGKFASTDTDDCSQSQS